MVKVGSMCHCKAQYQMVLGEVKGQTRVNNSNTAHPLYLFLQKERDEEEGDTSQLPYTYVVLMLVSYIYELQKSHDLTLL